ncbi:class I SAM-dependent DNA methyltransferase [Candidatus Poriferisocius sp.]|uniref:class I SAM-dependent DNA methyltransferase n=1 Tax=Candidatus Poriferisocius sp. TaxID=3101276 RepID=UPI003B020895
MSKKSDAEVALERAYATKGPEANRELYASWAPTYESGFMVDSGYVYHQEVVKVFCDSFSELNGPVLDVGCGTGVVGGEMAKLGVSVIDGIDISPEMLAEAAAKTHNGRPVYRQLVEADLTGRTGLADGAYAGIVSSGAFTHGVLGPETILELLRAASPGARFALGINSAHFEEFGFDHWLEQRRSDGHIAELEFRLRPIYSEADEDDPDQWTRIAVFAAV